MILADEKRADELIDDDVMNEPLDEADKRTYVMRYENARSVGISVHPHVDICRA